MLPRLAICNTYMRSFQYKILNNILFMNKKLHIFGTKSFSLCSSCNFCWKTLLDMFYHVTCLWSDLVYPFRAAHGWGRAKTHSLPKICHLYPTKMTLGKIMPYLKKTQKIYESRDTPHRFGWHQYFWSESSTFCYTRKYKI